MFGLEGGLIVRELGRLGRELVDGLRVLMGLMVLIVCDSCEGSVMRFLQYRMGKSTRIVIERMRHRVRRVDGRRDGCGRGS